MALKVSSSLDNLFQRQGSSIQPGKNNVKLEKVFQENHDSCGFIFSKTVLYMSSEHTMIHCHFNCTD